MALQPFTRNYTDNSTEAGFEFTFYCDLCNNGYKSQFIESKTYNKTGFLHGVAKFLALGAACLGQHDLGYKLEQGANILTERFEGMSPEWHREHEAAFNLGQEEAKRHFYRCPKCRLWVCNNDWNEEEGLCVECSPRLNVEVAAAKAEKMVMDIKEKAQNTQVFKGEVETKVTHCPECGKPVTESKFCVNCGADLSWKKCPHCGKNAAAETKFCGECGGKL